MANSTPSHLHRLPQSPTRRVDPPQPTRSRAPFFSANSRASSPSLLRAWLRSPPSSRKPNFKNAIQSSDSNPEILFFRAKKIDESGDFSVGFDFVDQRGFDESDQRRENSNRTRRSDRHQGPNSWAH
ncbi:hypothetical protein TorRG33x02_143940 [Trema orientale]|uniref:Uncharacterized protein n=1 Tax=Trema orientale TaxID=63057 RepID=A0A2P5EWG1_TREOI|nr:hypothetical protein TorRG33x02_143940 [Trema orientale]